MRIGVLAPDGPVSSNWQGMVVEFESNAVLLYCDADPLRGDDEECVGVS